MHTYETIAQNYQLWKEYVDPNNEMTEEEFNSLTIAEKVGIQQNAFGIESK